MTQNLHENVSIPDAKFRILGTNIPPEFIPDGKIPDFRYSRSWQHEQSIDEIEVPLNDEKFFDAVRHVSRGTILFRRNS